MNEPTWMHGHAQKRIIVALELWIGGAEGRGAVGVPVDVRLDERNVYGPDVVWYRHGRVPKLTDQPPYPMPDLAVEIRSPSSWRRDLLVKKPNYEQHGAVELWLVDTTARVVLISRRSAGTAARFDVNVEVGDDEVLTSPLLPGFGLPAADLFGAD
jgi:Uma2 family endonuclease